MKVQETPHNSDVPEFAGAVLPYGEADRRADALVKQMSIDEKIGMLGGYAGFYLRGVSRLNIPTIKTSDGPMGVHNDGRACAVPAAVALAASWDEESAWEIGVALGRESRARGVHVLLAPGVNIHRQPQCGRNFEYMGEDPYLAGQQAVAYIEGVQSQGVVATVKHYAANSQDHERHHTSSDMDERTLREIYLPAFRAAVREGGVCSVMTAYNLLNGVHCSENHHLNNEILRDEWGFGGYVISDWGGVHTTGVLTGGNDLEMPKANYMNGEHIKPLLASGELEEATIDMKVRRMLRTFIAMGFFERDQYDERISWDESEHREIALDVARKGMVLLKNDKLLPLNRDQIKRIAVVGPNTHPAVRGGGGSSRTTPFHETSILEGVQNIVGSKAHITHIPFAAAGRMEELVCRSTYTTTTSDGFRVFGMTASYYADADPHSDPVATRIETLLKWDYNSQNVPQGVDAENFAVRWAGKIQPETDGLHQLAVALSGSVRVWIDNDMVLKDTAAGYPLRLAQTQLELQAGRQYELEIELVQQERGGHFRFSWHHIDLEEISAADTVIFAAGYSHVTEGEGYDRSFELPAGQPELLRLVSEKNPRTAVVVNAGGAFDTSGWLDQCPALLHAWYGGQDEGQAVADILFGNVNPSGKLPISFEKRWEDSAAYGNYPGENGHMSYEEGIFVGYRHFDQNDIEPLFPFGYGLSYTSFEYSNLTQSADRMGADGSVTFYVDVTNTGNWSGAEIVQLYTEQPDCSVPRPPKELRRFSRVELCPGETRTVEMTLTPEDLEFFHPEQNGWTTESGTVTVDIGASSRDIRGRTTFTLS